MTAKRLDAACRLAKLELAVGELHAANTPTRRITTRLGIKETE